MEKIMLTINHNGRIFEPPVEGDIKIEWERTGSPGKLTFTTVKTDDSMAFQHGDKVCFYYGNADNPIFVGYVFTKKRDKAQRISVTCYDQIRYLKNEYTYVFENKTATQIIKAMCADFGLNTLGLEDTRYILPSVAEENTAAIDVIMSVLEETLLNTGRMYVLYDDAGRLRLQDCANMKSETMILEDTAENYDYSASIDEETYNSVVLYYVEENNAVSIYTASSKSRIKQWGTLRYFEEVKNKSIASAKAKAILDLYCKKTRELKVNGAFGDVTVRGGTLIPVKLNLGDTTTSNYMLVEKVTHKFNFDHYNMDLTLVGEWEDEGELDVQTTAIDNAPPPVIESVLPSETVEEEVLTEMSSDTLPETLTETEIIDTITTGKDIGFTVTINLYDYYDYPTFDVTLQGEVGVDENAHWVMKKMNNSTNYRKWEPNTISYTIPVINFHKEMQIVVEPTPRFLSQQLPVGYAITNEDEVSCRAIVDYVATQGVSVDKVHQATQRWLKLRLESDIESEQILSFRDGGTLELIPTDASGDPLPESKWKDTDKVIETLPIMHDEVITHEKVAIRPFTVLKFYPKRGGKLIVNVVSGTQQMKAKWHSVGGIYE